MTGPTDASVASFLKRHPRLLGALFALAGLLTQVTPVLADCNSSTCSGP